MLRLRDKRLGVGTECSIESGGSFRSRAPSRTCSLRRARESYVLGAWPLKGLHSRRQGALANSPTRAEPMYEYAVRREARVQLPNNPRDWPYAQVGGLVPTKEQHGHPRKRGDFPSLPLMGRGGLWVIFN